MNAMDLRSALVEVATLDEYESASRLAGLIEAEDWPETLARPRSGRTELAALLVGQGFMDHWVGRGFAGESDERDVVEAVAAWWDRLRDVFDGEHCSLDEWAFRHYQGMNPRRSGRAVVDWASYALGVATVEEWAFVQLPQLAEACPRCGGGRSEHIFAFALERE